MYKTKEDIERWLNKMEIVNYSINDDLRVDVNGDVNIAKKELKELPIKFGKITGSFDCSNNQLKNDSIVNFPDNCKTFFANNNLIDDIINFNSSKAASFMNNKITSLNVNKSVLALCVDNNSIEEINIKHTMQMLSIKSDKDIKLLNDLSVSTKVASESLRLNSENIYSDDNKFKIRTNSTREIFSIDTDKDSYEDVNRFINNIKSAALCCIKIDNEKFTSLYCSDNNIVMTSSGNEPNYIDDIDSLNELSNYLKSKIEYREIKEICSSNREQISNKEQKKNKL